MEPASHGAYGFRFLGLSHLRSVREALVPAPQDWPAVRVVLKREDGPWTSDLVVEDDHAILGLPQRGTATLDRRSASVTIATPAAVDPDWLVHPALAYVAAVFSRWHNRCSLHAGSFLAEEGAWGVLGSHESGKSTTLAWLAATGHAVLADDMLALGGRNAFAGPRTVDVRAAAAPFLDLDLDGKAELVREGDRRRVALPPTRTRYPLRGWFVLRWGERLGVREIPTGERLAALLEHMHPASSASGLRLFDLVALPGYELTRPKDIAGLPEAAGEMVRTASGGERRPPVRWTGAVAG